MNFTDSYCRKTWLWVDSYCLLFWVGMVCGVGALFGGSNTVWGFLFCLKKFLIKQVQRHELAGQRHPTASPMHWGITRCEFYPTKSHTKRNYSSSQLGEKRVKENSREEEGKDTEMKRWETVT